MALVEEKVKEEDRELFNSFVPNRKANECTKWIVDREKNIYFFWTGGEMRESIDEFFMSWDNLKVYIYTYTEISSEKDEVYIRINRISIPKVLQGKDSEKNEIVNTIKEILQILYNKSKVLFVSIAEPVVRKGEN